VLVRDGEIIGEGRNRPVASADPTAHAEIVALRAAAAATANYRLEGATLYVTLEPCAMCAGALVNARIARVVFGAVDERAGAAGSVTDVLRDGSEIHRVVAEGGLMHRDAADLLSRFFADRRN
jgi:tRNA(adenine34) deaminase